MKFSVENENYVCTVAKVYIINTLDGLDNLVGIPFFGYQALTSKNVQVGDLGLVFTAETQLSKNFCKENNLYREKELNGDVEKAGYIEKNRRVRAIKMRGHRSSALFMPLSSLDYLGLDLDLKEGDCFDSINGIKICQKYEIKVPQVGKSAKKAAKFKLNIRAFPEHLDTANYFKNVDKIKPEDTIIITQKLHGTSARVCNQLVEEPPKLLAGFLNKWFGTKFRGKKKWKIIAGSRRCLFFYEEDPNHPSIYIRNAQKIAHLVPKNWVIFGEIVGYDEDSPIFKRYTYEVAPGHFKFFVYRIAVINEDGISVDLPWNYVKTWCDQNGVLHVPEFETCLHRDFDANKYLNKNFAKEGLAAIPNSGNVDEGVCIRVDDFTPLILKAKSPDFLEIETKATDSNEWLPSHLS